MTKHAFKCQCGCVINVEFAANETKRRVPCPGCFADQPVHENVQEERPILNKVSGETEMLVVPVTKAKLDESGNPVRKKKGIVLDLFADGKAVVFEDYGDGGR